MARGYLREHGSLTEAETIDLLAENLADYRAHVHRSSEAELPATIARLLTEHGSTSVALPDALPEAWLTELGPEITRVPDTPPETQPAQPPAENPPVTDTPPEAELTHRRQKIPAPPTHSPKLGSPNSQQRTPESPTRSPKPSSPNRQQKIPATPTHSPKLGPPSPRQKFPRHRHLRSTPRRLDAVESVISGARSRSPRPERSSSTAGPARAAAC